MRNAVGVEDVRERESGRGAVGVKGVRLSASRGWSSRAAGCGGRGAAVGGGVMFWVVDTTRTAPTARARDTTAAMIMVVVWSRRVVQRHQATARRAGVAWSVVWLVMVWVASWVVVAVAPSVWGRHLAYHYRNAVRCRAEGAL